MSRWYIFRRLRVIIRKHPTQFFLCLGVLILVLYKGLNYFPWGLEVKRLALSMLSSEIGGYWMYVEGIAIPFILMRLFFADILNIFIDLYLVNIFLSVKSIKHFLNILGKAWAHFRSDTSEWLHKNFSKIFEIVFKCKTYISEKKYILGLWCKNHHLMLIARFLHADPVSGGLQNHLQGIANNPGKARLRTVFWLCQVPKLLPVPGFPGGVGIAVLVIKHNNYGVRGWIVLSIATVVRTFTWVGIYILKHKYGPALGPFNDLFDWIFQQ